MNTSIQKGTVTEQPRKSKRLSSLIWIFLLWIFVRLFAELDGISWTRSFFPDMQLLAAIPATLYLFSALIVPSQWLEKTLRWMALLIVIASFFGGFAIAMYWDIRDPKKVASILSICQAVFTCLILLGVVARVWILNKKEMKND